MFKNTDNISTIINRFKYLEAKIKKLWNEYYDLMDNRKFKDLNDQQKAELQFIKVQIDVYQNELEPLYKRIYLESEFFDDEIENKV